MAKIYVIEARKLGENVTWKTKVTFSNIKEGKEAYHHLRMSYYNQEMELRLLLAITFEDRYVPYEILEYNVTN